MIPEQVFHGALRSLLVPIDAHLRDPHVSEILVNGPANVFVERAGCLERSAARFDSEDALLSGLRVLAQFVGRPFDAEHPILEARMPDGARVEAVYGDLVKGGTHVAIRKFSRSMLSLSQLVQRGSLTQEAADFLRDRVLHKQNILVSGGTGTGKTSFLNMLIECIPDAERVVVLEDARELNPRSAHVVQLEARVPDRRGKGEVSIRALLRATLRLRPDRIVVGEIRDGAALDLLQAMTSGHDGCLSSLHASHPLDALRRLETLALSAGVELPLPALRSQVASAVHWVVQLARLADGARVVTHVSEVCELDAQGRYVLRDAFVRTTFAGTTQLFPADRSDEWLDALRNEQESEGGP